MTVLYDLLSLDKWALSPAAWLVFCLAVFIVGFSKTGVPGITILAVPLMASIIPPKESVGVLLPVYMIADIVSVRSYWRFTRWRYCFPYLVFVGAGVWLASLIIDMLDDRTFALLIGWTILILLLFSFLLDFFRNGKQTGELPPKDRPSLPVSASFGLSAGLVSALANAAGPIVSLYMILSRLDKYAFLGTTAVCAFFMNWIKVPLFLSLGIINTDTLKLDVAAVPLIVLGGLTGIAAAKRLPQKAFKNLVLLLAMLASVKLILG